MSVVACLIVQHEAAMQQVGSTPAFRLAWDRLTEIRGVERKVVVASAEFMDRVVKQLKKAGNGPGKYIVLPPSGLETLMTRLTEKPLNAMAASGHDYPADEPLSAEDVVIFDRGLSPYASGGTLENCFADDSVRLVCPGMKEYCSLKLAGADKATLSSVSVLNTTLGVYRGTAPNGIAHVTADRMEMLQIDRPQDMTIAHALALYGTD